MSENFWKILIVAVAGSFEIVIVWGRFTVGSTIAGLILVSILLTVPARAVEGWSERLAASLTWAVSLALVVGRFLKAPLATLFERGISPSIVIFALWLGLAVVSFLVLRSRASKAES